MQNVGVLFISPHISLYVLNDVIPQVIMLNKSTARASNQVAFFFHKNAVSIFTNMFCVDSLFQLRTLAIQEVCVTVILW